MRSAGSPGAGRLLWSFPIPRAGLGSSQHSTNGSGKKGVHKSQLNTDPNFCLSLEMFKAQSGHSEPSSARIRGMFVWRKRGKREGNAGRGPGSPSPARPRCNTRFVPIAKILSVHHSGFVLETAVGACGKAEDGKCHRNVVVMRNLPQEWRGDLYSAFAFNLMHMAADA